jgi:hypothetical protein
MINHENMLCFFAMKQLFYIIDKLGTKSTEAHMIYSDSPWDGLKFTLGVTQAGNVKLV